MLTAYAAAFRGAALGAPVDDAPRRILADWLEDHGQPERADFIRTQLALAHLPADSPERLELRARARALLDEHGRAWAGPLPRLVESYEFRRGLVEWARLNSRRLLRHGSQLFRLAPVRHLTLSVERGQGPAVAACAHLERLEALDLFLVNAEDAEAVLGSPHLANLRALRLRGGANALAGAHSLARLESLDVGSNNLGDDGAWALLQARLPALRSLTMSGNWLGDGAARALAAAPLLAHVSELDLSRNSLGPAGVEALAGSVHASGLRALWLGFNPVGDSGAITAARLPLRRLYLGRTQVGPAGISALSGSATLAGLTHLDLDYNPRPADGLRALLRSPHLGRLEALYLRFEPELPRRLRQQLEARFGPGVCRF
jgi:uncharacterized protein (TIGR02996 family)